MSLSSATLAYSATATNATPAALNAAMAAVVLYTSAANDSVLEQMFGATVSSDVTTTAGSVITRTLVLAVGAQFNAEFPGGDGAFNDLFGKTLAKALSTPIVSAPVVFA